jgi:hypothetical protein
MFQSQIATLWHHDYTYVVAGTLSNYAGTGVGIEVAIYESGTDNLLGQTVTTAGGAFTFNWFDNTIPVYVVAYEDATHKGVSEQAVAGSTFDIDLNPASGGGEYFF